MRLAPFADGAPFTFLKQAQARMSERKSSPMRQTGIDSLMSRSWVTSCREGCPVHTLPILPVACRHVHVQ